MTRWRISVHAQDHRLDRRISCVGYATGAKSCLNVSGRTGQPMWVEVPVPTVARIVIDGDMPISEIPGSYITEKTVVHEEVVRHLASVADEVTNSIELQAAATDNGINIALAEQHSFPLADVFHFLHSEIISCKQTPDLE